MEESAFHMMVGLDFDSWSPLSGGQKRITGEWWIPGESENKKPGTLTLAPSKWPSLELDGTLLSSKAPDMNQPHDIDAVRGRLETGEHLTLLDCAAFPEIGIGSTYYQNLDIVAQRVISGPWWVNPDSARFERVDVQFAGLSAWTRPLGLFPNRDEGDENETVVRYSHYEPQTAQFDDRTTAELRAHARSIPEQDQDAASWTLEENFFFRLTLDPPGPPARFARRISILEKFLAFCTQQPAPSFRWGMWREAAERGERYDVHTGTHISRGLESEPDQRDWLFALQHVRSDFDEILRSWVELNRQNEDLVDLVLEPVYSNELSNSTEFLNLMRSMEALYGHLEGPGVRRGINDAIAGPLMATLTHGLPDKAKDCIQFQPHDRSHATFVTKIRTVIKQTASLAGDSITIGDKLLGSIKATRDYYAHHDPSLQGGAIRYDVLPLWNQFFRRVVNLAILDVIGVSSGDIRSWHQNLQDPLDEAEALTD